jgi:hypothetical protein
VARDDSRILAAGLVPVANRALVAVSWCMPPQLFPRSIQVARTLKGLGRLGWRSIVVTAAADAFAARDSDATLADAYAGNYSLIPVGITRADQKSGPLVERWRERLNGDSVASDEALWSKRATAAAAGAIRRDRPAALLTFAQPWRDHLVGLRLREQHPHLPWIAHFSDPWTDSIYSVATGAHRDRDLEQEAAVIAQASRIVFTNEHAADLVMRKYPAPLRAKARVIPHAMDPETMPEGRPSRTSGSGPLRMAHVGNLFVGQRTAGALFDALAVLNARQPLDGRLQLTFIGEGSGLQEALEHVFIRRLESIVSFVPRVPYFDSLARMADSDVLLLIDAPSAVNAFLPSKLVDYLMAERPVMALTPASGAPARILGGFGYPVIDPEDTGAIATTVGQLLRDHESGRLLPAAPRSALAPFSLEATAGAFHDILEECVSRAAA